MSSFSANLRYLCQFHESISEICRNIDFNRQQFNKYLNGKTIPSGFNLNRIAVYFDVDVSDLFLEKREFAEKYQRESGSSSIQLPHKLTALIAQAFPGNSRKMRRFTGYYLSYFPSVPNSNSVLCSLIYIYEDKGYFFSKTIERSRPSAKSTRAISKYSGLVSYLNGYIYISEFETLTKDSIVETILSAPYRTELQYLSGLTFGNTTSRSRNPFAARTAWVYLGKSIDLKLALKKCGDLPENSPKIDPTIRGLLGLDAKDVPNAIRI